jgi:hypothetical protein
LLLLRADAGQAQRCLAGSLCLGGLPPEETSLAAVPVPSRRSLLGAVLGGLQARAKARNTTSRLAAAVQQHAMTFAGLAAVDVGMFHIGPVAGWVSVGVSILLADFKIQG